VRWYAPGAFTRLELEPDHAEDVVFGKSYETAIDTVCATERFSSMGPLSDKRRAHGMTDAGWAAARWLLLEIARLAGVVGPKSGRRAVCQSGAPVEPRAKASGSRTAAHGAWGGRTMMHRDSLRVRPGRGAVASAARVLLAAGSYRHAA